MKVTFAIAGIVTTILVLPPWMFGVLDDMTAVTCAVYSFASSAIVMMFH